MILSLQTILPSYHLVKVLVSMDIRHAVGIGATVRDRGSEFVNETHRLESVVVGRSSRRLLYLMIGQTLAFVLSLRGMSHI